MSKTCRVCNEPKPADGYYADSRECKECTKARVILNRKKNLAYYQEHDRLRNKVKDRRTKTAGYLLKRRERSPEKYSARTAVTTAIKYGRLIRKPCQVCGNPKVEAHHPDYSKPLEVDWLCFRHHHEIHGQTILT